MRPSGLRGLRGFLSLLAPLALLSGGTTLADETPPAAAAQPAPVVASGADGMPRVRFETTAGAFTLRLNPARSPKTVENFLKYVKDDHYNGTVFHRVIENFVAQGGGYTADGKLRKIREAVVNESGNGLTNKRGTIAMARAEGPHSADSQFYINLMDNPVLDPQASRWGYAVFGDVVEGIEILDRIGHSPTGKSGPFPEDAPLQPIVIQKAEILK